MQVADPEGYFKSGSRAAEAAKAKAQKAMQLEKQQQEAQERRRKEKLVRQHPACHFKCLTLILLGVSLLSIDDASGALSVAMCCCLVLIGVVA